MYSNFKYDGERFQDHKRRKNLIYKSRIFKPVLPYESTYEPGKWHWLKQKKDYLFNGAIADLVFLDIWYQMGYKGEIMTVLLMGCFNENKNCWYPVVKVLTGHGDTTLDRFQNRPMWEIMRAEFTNNVVQNIGKISVRFPRVIRIRSDEEWSKTTSLNELKDCEIISLKTSSKKRAASSTPSLPVTDSIKGNIVFSPIYDSTKKELVENLVSVTTSNPSKIDEDLFHEVGELERLWKRIRKQVRGAGRPMEEYKETETAT